MNYFEAPNYTYFAQDGSPTVNKKDSLFIAGSITGASDWQKAMSEKLIPHYHIFNPRRKDFDVTKPEMEKEQITWEFEALAFCDTVIFYFAPETLAPITLFEYGKMLMKKGKNLFVCVHPEYKRKNDVLIQTELEVPNLAKRICFDLETLAGQVIDNKIRLTKYGYENQSDREGGMNSEQRDIEDAEKKGLICDHRFSKGQCDKCGLPWDGFDPAAWHEQVANFRAEKALSLTKDLMR